MGSNVQTILIYLKNSSVPIRPFLSSSSEEISVDSRSPLVAAQRGESYALQRATLSARPSSIGKTLASQNQKNPLKLDLAIGLGWVRFGSGQDYPYPQKSYQYPTRNLHGSGRVDPQNFRVGSG